MNTKEILRQYKSDYTHLEEDAKILRFYLKGYKSTYPFDNIAPILITEFLDDSTGVPGSTIYKFLLEDKERRFMKLYSEFLKKWNQRKSDFSDFSETFVLDKVKIVITEFIALKPSYIIFDLTEDCSVFFQVLVDDKNIYLELFFTHDVMEGVEAVLNIYVNRECIFAYGSTIRNTFSKITSMVKNEDLISQPTIDYELSETTFA